MTNHGDGLHYAVREASCKLGRVVGAGLLSEEEAVAMLEAAVTNKAKDMGNAMNTIRSGVTLGQSNPFVIIQSFSRDAFTIVRNNTARDAYTPIRNRTARAAA